VLGEVGLFAAGGTRALTALCEGDCRLWTITKEKTLEIYYQNPNFGMFFDPTRLRLRAPPRNSKERRLARLLGYTCR
jgi:hypothetical protein